MKIKLLLILFLPLAILQYGLAELPEDPVEYAKWESTLLDAVSNQSKISPEISIPKLGNWIHQLSVRRFTNLEKGERPVFHAAQAALLAIPGHAEYYDKKIRKSMDEEAAKTGGDERQRIWDFETLEQLPSPETVKVLGELLYDDRNPWKGMNFYDTPAPTPDDKLASMTLTRLGIKKAPVKNTNPYGSGHEDSEVEAWKVWYEQVKAGTRTFSFEGDDTLYNLNGPTTVARDGPIQSRPDHKASSADPKNGADSHTENKTPIIVAVLILLGIVAFTVKQRKSRIS